MTDNPLLRLGTRGSPLALAQSAEVRARLISAHSEFAEEGAIATEIIRTTGDRVQDRSLADLGGKGLFTKEIDEALLDGRIDVAVHSLKDVPTWLPEGLVIAAVLPREDPRDALFSSSEGGLAKLPRGARVGTCSLRRKAQLLLLRPDLEVVDLRGNVETRLRKLAAGEVAATLLAIAGLRRLGKGELVRQPLTTDEMLPAVAQGAIGLIARADDTRTREVLAPLQDAASAMRVLAERACLDVLQGSCKTPIAVLAELDGTARIEIRARLAFPDGSRVFEGAEAGAVENAEAIGRALGEVLRAKAGSEFFAQLGLA